MTTASSARIGARRPAERGVAFVLPAIVLIGLVQILPALYSLWASLQDIRFYKDFGFVGLAHFAQLLGDPATYQAAERSLIYTGASLALAIGLALSVALMVRHFGTRGTVIATLVLIPWAMSPVAVAIIWKWILAPFGGGLLATTMAFFGLGPVSLLSDPTTSMITLIAVSVWRNFAFAAIVLTAGLSQIPEDLYRAGAVDGAGAWRQFRSITLPLLRPSLLIAMTVLTISYFNEVQVIIALTGGGPYDSTMTLAYRLYDFGFLSFDQGTANALGVLMFVINIGLLVVLARATRPRPTRVSA